MSPVNKYNQKMTKNYTRYTADQLLNDDFFLESELHPTPESQLFWNQLEKERMNRWSMN